MRKKIKVGLILLISTVILIIIGGTLFFKISEGLTWLDSFYSTSLLMSTAGLGNLVPTKASTKIFTIIFALIGIPLVLFCMGYIIEEFYKKRIQKLQNEMEEIIKKEDKITKIESEILKKEKELLKERQTSNSK